MHILIILCLTVYAIITADKVDIKISVDGKEVFKYNKKIQMKKTHQMIKTNAFF